MLATSEGRRTSSGAEPSFVIAQARRKKSGGEISLSLEMSERVPPKLLPSTR
jgi:hypothetical protein